MPFLVEDLSTIIYTTSMHPRHMRDAISEREIEVSLKVNDVVYLSSFPLPCFTLSLNKQNDTTRQTIEEKWGEVHRRTREYRTIVTNSTKEMKTTASKMSK
jgi:hypothetical protein